VEDRDIERYSGTATGLLPGKDRLMSSNFVFGYRSRSDICQRGVGSKILDGIRNAITAEKRTLGPEDLMTPDNVAIPNVQTLKFRRDELFREFEDHPGKLALAREIKAIDDQIAELNVCKKKARTESPK